MKLYALEFQVDGFGADTWVYGIFDSYDKTKAQGEEGIAKGWGLRNYEIVPCKINEEIEQAFD